MRLWHVDLIPYLPRQQLLAHGKYSSKGLLVEGIFKYSSIRNIWFNKKTGVMLDVKEDPTVKDLTNLFKGSLNTLERCNIN